MKKIVILFILFFGISTLTEAQILRSIVNSARNKAEDKVEEKAEEEVDKQVSKFFDSLMEKDTTETNESEEPEEAEEPEEEDMPQTRQSMSNFMNAFGVSSKDVKKKDVYRFDGQIVMITEGTEEDGTKVDPVEYTVSYNEDNSDILFKFQDQEGKKAAIIMDTENKVSLILSDDGSEKSGIAANIDDDEELGSSESSDADIEDEEDDCLVKTGNKRTISGYSCKEYRCENSEEVFSMWVTDDLSREKNRLLRKSPMGASFHGGKVDGMVIEYDWKSKIDKSSSKMTVKEISPNKSSSFSTEDYEIVSFGMNLNK